MNVNFTKKALTSLFFAIFAQSVAVAVPRGGRAGTAESATSNNSTEHIARKRTQLKRK